MKKRDSGDCEQPVLYRNVCRLRGIDAIEHSEDVQRELVHGLVNEIPLPELLRMFGFRSRTLTEFGEVVFEYEVSLKARRCTG